MIRHGCWPSAGPCSGSALPPGSVASVQGGGAADCKPSFGRLHGGRPSGEQVLKQSWASTGLAGSSVGEKQKEQRGAAEPQTLPRLHQVSALQTGALAQGGLGPPACTGWRYPGSGAPAEDECESQVRLWGELTAI